MQTDTATARSINAIVEYSIAQAIELGFVRKFVTGLVFTATNTVVPDGAEYVKVRVSTGEPVTE